MVELQPPRVLLVGGVASTAAIHSDVLAHEGIITQVVFSSGEAIAIKRLFEPTVALIELLLPVQDGRKLVERFADDGDCGIMLMTDTEDETARIDWLDSGADDYLLRSMPIRELAARVRALHRRMEGVGLRARETTRVMVDWTQRRLSGPNDCVSPLTEAEFFVLETLLDAHGAPVSRDQLGRSALKRSVRVDDRSIDQLVLKLRRKLVRHGLTNGAILSTRGLGYVISDAKRFSWLATVASR